MSNDGRMNPLIRTLLILTACYVVGFVGSIAVNGALDFWYVTLKRPVWAPPVWCWVPGFTLVFGLLGVALALLSSSTLDQGKGKVLGAKIVVALTILLTGIWQWIFFAGHQLIPAMIGAIALALASAISAGLALRIRPFVGSLLVVVTLWNAYLVLFTASLR
jgi:translocator protein